MTSMAVGQVLRQLPEGGTLWVRGLGRSMWPLLRSGDSLQVLRCAAEAVAPGDLAVLLRALAPLDGIDEIRAARPKARRDLDLTNGPARLTQALGITGVNDGADLVTGDQGILIVDDGTPPPDAPVATPRIGISKAAEEPWRWYVPGEPNVSRPLFPKPRQ